MASKTVKVGSSVGLHARPASIIADAAAEFDEDIFLALAGEEDDDETDAASSLMIMALGAEQGDEVTVTSDNAEAVEKIAGLIEQDLTLNHYQKLHRKGLSLSITEGSDLCRFIGKLVRKIPVQMSDSSCRAVSVSPVDVVFKSRF